jgi:hypothetical protein
MRLELIAAWILGIALPVLETLRRGTHVETVASYVDDYIAGALLLYAAWSVSRRRASVRSCS